MGIRGLTSLIKKYSPESINVYKFEFYKNSTIAIDTSILLYKFRSNISYSMDTHSHSSSEKKHCHIQGFLNKCMRYITAGITPVFVLDGKPPIEKNDTIFRRTLKKQKIISKIRVLETKLGGGDSIDILREIDRLSRQNIYITKEHRDESKELLQILGFDVIHMDAEAESICAQLQQSGYVNFTFTDDTDAIVLGCEKVLRSDTNDTFSEITLELVLKGLKLDYLEFVDLCILCGCDYCPPIPRIGCITAYNLILEYKTLEKVLDSIKETYTIPDYYPYEQARMLFMKKPIVGMVVCKKKIIPNENRLKSFLLQRNFRIDYIDKYITKFKQKIIYCNNNSEQCAL